MSTVFEAMKLSAKESLRLAFPYYIPPTIHRDVILLYSMGWIDSLKMIVETTTNPTERQNTLGMIVECLQSGYADICDENWLPDSSWIWWARPEHN